LLARETDSHTWFDAILSFLPEHDWPVLVTQAVEILTHQPKNRAAESVLEEATTQCPAGLHPHLDAIFTHRFLATTYYSTWPWRDSGSLHRKFLLHAIQSRTTRREDITRAWEALLETRTDENIALALEWAEPVFVATGGDRSHFERWLNAYVHEMGLTREEDGIRSLYGETTWHLAFPEGYSGKRRFWDLYHPTWDALTDLTEPLAFGGTAGRKCGFCGGELHRMLTLDPVPDGIGVTSVKRLSLEVCLSCLGWEEHTMFFEHSRKGDPSPLRERPGSQYTPQFPVGPLQPTNVRLGRAGRRWHWQSWAGSNSRQNLHRVGGPGVWVQSASYPTCPGCDRGMLLLMQLDSNLPMEGVRREWLWGSGGMGYGHWCDRCRISAWHWQCT
jgi:hypothetical protein